MCVQNCWPNISAECWLYDFIQSVSKQIKEVLGEMIHHDQVGYIKDRNIGVGVRLIEDIY